MARALLPPPPPPFEPPLALVAGGPQKPPRTGDPTVAPMMQKTLRGHQVTFGISNYDDACKKRVEGTLHGYVRGPPAVMVDATKLFTKAKKLC